ncbi:2-oxoacid:acceptor oxidoreductase family protein [Vibrio sp. MEBiC08052]|uniref:2-oxoacid:acceptor oxidoreductase family protein n=1 Tax=Vibrio sp. MEBiC08052 TaxID=1761910 RepID=UPI000A6BDC14|nr:2-oxoacid:acceptor oxidoreductase family protein [Vibrio sp. MEBiC08052]
MSQFNIVLCGLGGQGIVSLTKIFGELAINSGFDIKINNIIGLGQRGGSVSSHIRINKEEKVISPMIEYGSSDILIGLEKTELFRNIHYLKENGICFFHDYNLTSPTINTKLENEVEFDLDDILKRKKQRAICIDDYINQEKIESSINFLILPILLKLINFDNIEEFLIRKKSRNLMQKIAAVNIGYKVSEEINNHVY